MRNHDRPATAGPGPGCLQASVEDPAGVVLMPANWTDPGTGARVPADARCRECGELYGLHRHLGCCVEICGRCGEERARCVCDAA